MMQQWWETVAGSWCSTQKSALTGLKSHRTNHMEPSATSFTVIRPVGKCLQVGTEYAPFSTTRRRWDVFMILAPDINIQTYLLTYCSSSYQRLLADQSRDWERTAAFALLLVCHVFFIILRCLCFKSSVLAIWPVCYFVCFITKMWLEKFELGWLVHTKSFICV